MCGSFALWLLVVAVDGCGDDSSSGLAHWSVVGFVVADVAQVANSVIISLLILQVHSSISKLQAQKASFGFRLFFDLCLKMG